ncbi:peptidase S53, partial [Mycobacterium sp. ITM-2017-0098]
MMTVAVRSLCAVLLVGAALFGIGLSVSEHRPDDKLIEGPYASLLDASTDLGPAREQSIEFTASL